MTVDLATAFNKQRDVRELWLIENGKEVKILTILQV